MYARIMISAYFCMYLVVYCVYRTNTDFIGVKFNVELTIGQTIDLVDYKHAFMSSLVIKAYCEVTLSSHYLLILISCSLNRSCGTNVLKPHIGVGWMDTLSNTYITGDQACYPLVVLVTSVVALRDLV